jgi:hypothetical protein
MKLGSAPSRRDLRHNSGGQVRCAPTSRRRAIRLRECAVAASAEVQAAADFAIVALDRTAELATARCRVFGRRRTK